MGDGLADVGLRELCDHLNMVDGIKAEVHVRAFGEVRLVIALPFSAATILATPDGRLMADVMHEFDENWPPEGYPQ